MKKIIFSISFIVLAICMSTVYSYAATNNSALNEMSNNIKNVVGGAENKLEDAAKGATDAAKNGAENLKNGITNGAEDAKNGAKETGNNVKNGVENAGNTLGNGINDLTNNGEYTATRTAADGGSTNGFMTTETWSWIIIGVVAIAIIALFWYYATRTKNDKNHH